MSTAINMFMSGGLDCKVARNQVKKQLRLIRKGKVDIPNILEELKDSLSGDYAILQHTRFELVIKVDRKPKVQQAMNNVGALLERIIDNPELNPDTLFRVTRHDNEISIRAKRHNE